MNPDFQQDCILTLHSVGMENVSQASARDLGGIGASRALCTATKATPESNSQVRDILYCMCLYVCIYAWGGLVSCVDGAFLLLSVSVWLCVCALRVRPFPPSTEGIVADTG